jgi:hypothetical protein
MQATGKKPEAWSAMVAGVGLVLRQQRLLWWLFLANFVMGVIAVAPVRLTLGNLLDHSLASRSLTDHFDLSAYIEVLSSPQFSFGIFRSLSLLTSLVFALIVLFAEPGVIQEFRQATGVNARPSRQTAGEFFGVCGAFLARMVRLLLWSLIPLGVFAVFLLIAAAIIPVVTETSPSETTGLNLAFLLGLIFFLLFAAVRVWISMAEIELVASGEQKTRRTLFAAARKLAFANFGKLYTIQLVTAIATVVVTLLGLTIWVKFVPPEAVGAAFIVSEATLLLLLACRLWQRASLVIWYERWTSLQPRPAELQLQQQESIVVMADPPITVPTTSENQSGDASSPTDGADSDPNRGLPELP